MGTRRRPNVTLYQPKYRDRNGKTKIAGVWWIQVSVSGKQRRKSTGVYDRKAAEQIRDAVQERLLMETSSQDAPLMAILKGRRSNAQLGAILGFYLKGIRSRDLTEQYFKDTEREAKRLFVSLGGEEVLAEEITTDKVQDAIIKWRDEEGLSNASIKRLLVTLTGAYGAAVREGHIVKVPFSIKSPKVLPRKAVVSADEYRKLNKHLDFSRPIDRALAIAMYTGLRLGDILEMTWASIHLDEKVPYLQIVPDKTKASSGKEVTVPLFGPLLSWLISVPENEQSGAVVGHKAKHLSRPFSDRVKEILGENCSYTAHAFRHTVADRLKHNPLLAQQVGGLKDMKMVDYYASPTGLAQAANEMSKTLVPDEATEMKQGNTKPRVKAKK